MMKNLKVSAKLLVSFGLVLVLTLAVGVVGIVGITQMSGAAQDTYENRSRPLGDLTTSIEYFQRIRVQTLTAIIYSGDAAHLATVERDLLERIEHFESSMDVYAPTIATQEGKDVAAVIVQQQDNIFRPGVIKVLEDAKQGMPTEQLMEEFAVASASADTIAASLTKLVELRMGVMETANTDNASLGDILLIIVIGVIVLAIIISIFLALYISKLISKPLGILSDFMHKAGTTGDIILRPEDVSTIQQYARSKDEIGQTIANAAAFVGHVNNIASELATVAGGDLTNEIKLLSGNDTMGVSLKDMLTNLNDMFGEISNSTAQVNTGSKQIADGSQALAQGSTQQAAAVEQLSSSITEIAQKTKDNAEMASKAANLAGTIKTNAEKGSRQMDEMMVAVKEIN
ncbi:MAG: methyl-accepting chemotaxis protein, partial [Oscillospiraceae bacterium]|nr:methyl-accepting chemotaxis protein [Oscillospiraceae bacterium]